MCDTYFDLLPVELQVHIVDSYCWILDWAQVFEVWPHLRQFVVCPLTKHPDFHSHTPWLIYRDTKHYVYHKGIPSFPGNLNWQLLLGSLTHGEDSEGEVFYYHATLFIHTPDTHDLYKIELELGKMTATSYSFSKGVWQPRGSVSHFNQSLSPGELTILTRLCERWIKADYPSTAPEFWNMLLYSSSSSCKS